MHVLPALVRKRRADGWRSSVTDRVKDEARVESEAVERDLVKYMGELEECMWTRYLSAHVKCEPGVRGSEENFAVLPLSEVVKEVTASSEGSVDPNVLLLVVVNVSAGRKEGVDVAGSLLDVALYVHGETGRLREGKAEVESNRARNGTKSDEEPPAEVLQKVSAG